MISAKCLSMLKLGMKPGENCDWDRGSVCMEPGL